MENETGGEGEKETNGVMQMPEPSVVYTASYGAARSECAARHKVNTNKWQHSTDDSTVSIFSPCSGLQHCKALDLLI